MSRVQGREYVSDRLREWVAKGRAEQARDTLLRILTVRGLRVTDGEHKKIMACDDLDQLVTWTDRAITETSTASLLRP
jgi:hypothetical protein